MCSVDEKILPSSLTNWWRGKCTFTKNEALSMFEKACCEGENKYIFVSNFFREIYCEFVVFVTLLSNMKFCFEITKMLWKHMQSIILLKYDVLRNLVSREMFQEFFENESSSHKSISRLETSVGCFILNL